MALSYVFIGENAFLYVSKVILKFISQNFEEVDVVFFMISCLYTVYSAVWAAACKLDHMVTKHNSSIALQFQIFAW